ncbi:unnamed protein product [marine sediment metagenome]|uniref:Phosphoadenosine phosphosulphate reductase domain-containing protein n=1 Tax=marine sediment metagenome TaxID=412755 RepID=X1J5S3_9ZZZZ
MILPEKIGNSKRLIQDAVDKYMPQMAIASSFGKDSMVLIHLARQIDIGIKVFYVVTPFKPDATLFFKNSIVRLWNLNYSEYKADGDNLPVGLWKTDPDRCCEIYKVAPFRKAVKDLNCWLSGIRSKEGRTRGDYEEVEEKDGLVKINPLLQWSEMDIWRYAALYRIPMNPLYRIGARSLGCEPCTHIVDDDADERNGRWAGTSKVGGECGIHTKSLREGVET